MKKPKFPIHVKRGNVTVKIYRTPTRDYESYTVAFYQAGKRQRLTFANLQTAKQEAETKANQMCAGELDALTLTNADRSAYVRSLELLGPLKTPLELAVLQYVEAAKLLGGASLVEAAKFYAKHHCHSVVQRTVPEVIPEMLKSKSAEGLSQEHVRTLKSLLGPFAQVFPVPISVILSAELQDYLHHRPVGLRSKNNHRKAIQTLFHFAQGRGYLPKGLCEADSLSAFKEPPPTIGIFKPEAMACLLQHASADLVPLLAIGAFAGLRASEIRRLDWSEVDLEAGFIEVKAKKAKTASRRLVPISGNLKQWLTPYHEGSGKVVPQVDVSHKLRELAHAKAVQVTWPPNGLRHSYISYRVALVQDVARVALEAGNSPAVIFSNYRELVKPAEAKKWFGIMPEQPANVVMASRLPAEAA